MTTISLKAGWNEVLYTGITQSVEAAFASILPYLEAVYYWDGSSWVIPTTMVTGNYYSIKVSQDCEWTFEVFEPPYTEVTIEAPDSAVAGETVPVTIKIRNKYYAPVHVAAIGIYDSEERFIDWEEYWILAGATHSFLGSFVMPARDVTIHAYSYYEAEDGGWYYDNEDEKPVSLEEVEVYAGTISGIELEHDGIQEGLPVYNIPQGQTARVHIWGRNDTNKYQTLGIGWIVTDPDGSVVEMHEDDWAAGWVGAGQDREFVSYSRFNLSKVGTYRIAIALYMNSADPIEVDSWEGTLCSVEEAVPEPEFAGFGITEYTKV